MRTLCLYKETTKEQSMMTLFLMLKTILKMEELPQSNTIHLVRLWDGESISCMNNSSNNTRQQNKQKQATICKSQKNS